MQFSTFTPRDAGARIALFGAGYDRNYLQIMARRGGKRLEVSFQTRILAISQAGL